MATKKTPDKTIEDVIVNQTINTDRLEIAIEKATHRIVTEIDSIPISPSSSLGGMPTIIGPGKYDDKLLTISHNIESVKETLFVVIATMIGVGLLFMAMMGMLISSVQHIQNGSFVPDEPSGSEQSTSTEGEVSPETPDQNHPQSASDAPQQD